ncbi:MAG TPA: hypothetical protein VI461_02945 [Chitinophagaceae bacterium]|nr:hypothetical protein [Chitinophagaceae bacterium]
MNSPVRKWLQISLFNLLLVAVIGVIMRYKIAYSLPWVDQRNLLHAHSHFAFAGWITQALMSLLVSYLFEKGDTAAFKRYRPVLYSNLVTAYGMLVTFPFMGYTFLSIVFSTLSIFVSYWFAIKYWRDLNKLPEKSISHHWFKAAVLFNAVSSLGAFSLAYMLATKNIHPDRYLASIYFFLHFQYNGWFFFACMGFLSYQLNKYGASENQLKKIYLFFVAACVPAYFLSALWLPIPELVYILVVVAVFLQLIGWIMLLQLVRRVLPAIKQRMPIFPRILFALCALALTIKLLLQAGSVIPSLSQLAFGFRPIVIGYLHLVLLGVITLFIIAYIVAFKLIPVNEMTRRGIIVFTAGIIANEALLMIQGTADMYYYPVPFINQFLLVAALILFTGILFINLGQQSGRYDLTHKLPEND